MLLFFHIRILHSLNLSRDVFLYFPFSKRDFPLSPAGVNSSVAHDGIILRLFSYCCRVSLPIPHFAYSADPLVFRTQWLGKFEAQGVAMDASENVGPNMWTTGKKRRDLRLRLR